MEPAGRITLAHRCNTKTIAKFSLLYFTSLSIVVLIFTALNQETLTATQSTWWWAFLFSLIITSSSAATTLGVLLYFEAYYIIGEDYDQATVGKSSGSPVTQDTDIGNSASFKTVLTINSALPTTTRDGPILEQEPDNIRKTATIKSPDNPLQATTIQSFALKGPVTVVDMRKNPKDRSLAPIPPPVLSDTSLIGFGDDKKSTGRKSHRTKKVVEIRIN